MKKIILNYAGVILLSMLIVFIYSCNKDEENKAPTISSVLVNPSTVNANGVATVSVTANDPDGDALTYAYNVSGGAIVGNGASATWTAAAMEGAYSVTVTVTDGNGGQASSNASLTVLAPVTQVTGTASFLAGTSGDLSNAKVSLYSTYEDWNTNQPIKFGAVTGAGASVSFTLSNVNPGNYYLDIWKDIDNSGTWSSGDYVGWYGSGGLGSPTLTQLQVAQGQTFNCTVQMYIIAKDMTFKKLKFDE
ncbi:MAG: hypothetical protein C0591_08065 [Marinilabiliales bacterium]|nr:MAG: hypothetical protein C0591_08065 [Marinilabiliales bacterium]